MRTRIPVRASGALVLTYIAALAGCHAPTCDLVATVGLHVTVVDSASMAPLPVPATLEILGDHQDTLPHPGDTGFDGHTFDALIGQPGTYTLVVRAEGYETLTLTNVVVPRDRCGDAAATISVTVKLKKTGA